MVPAVASRCRCLRPRRCHTSGLRHVELLQILFPQNFWRQKIKDGLILKTIYSSHNDMNSNELTTNFDLLTRKKCKYKQPMMCCVKNA